MIFFCLGQLTRSWIIIFRIIWTNFRIFVFMMLSFFRIYCSFNYVIFDNFRLMSHNLKIVVHYQCCENMFQSFTWLSISMKHYFLYLCFYSFLFFLFLFFLFCSIKRRIIVYLWLWLLALSFIFLLSFLIKILLFNLLKFLKNEWLHQ